MADFCLQFEGAEWVAVSGKLDGNLVIAVRNHGIGRAAPARSCARLFGDIGSAGGHRNMAKAVIPLTAPGGGARAHARRSAIEPRLRELFAGAQIEGDGAGQLIADGRRRRLTDPRAHDGLPRALGIRARSGLPGAAPSRLSWYEPMSVAEATVEVKNRLGLHLRAASTLAQTVANSNPPITIARGKDQVNARSVTGLMMLGAGKGTKLKVGPRATTRARRWPR